MRDDGGENFLAFPSKQKTSRLIESRRQYTKRKKILSFLLLHKRYTYVLGSISVLQHRTEIKAAFFIALLSTVKVFYEER